MRRTGEIREGFSKKEIKMATVLHLTQVTNRAFIPARNTKN